MYKLSNVCVEENSTIFVLETLLLWVVCFRNNSHRSLYVVVIA